MFALDGSLFDSLYSPSASRVPSWDWKKNRQKNKKQNQKTKMFESD